MEEIIAACKKLSDEQLVSRLKSIIVDERGRLNELLIHLAEFDERRLHAQEGLPSLFVYCTRALKYSEQEAYLRIHAARAARDYPVILGMLARGELHLSAVALLTPHLNEKNAHALLKEASGKTKIELEMIIARIAPRRIERDFIRPLGSAPEPVSSERTGRLLHAPDSAFATLESRDSGPPEPTSPALDGGPPGLMFREQRIRFAFTGGEALLRLLRRAQEVLKHKYPAGDLAEIFAEALDFLLDKKDPERRLRRKEESGTAPRPAGPPVGCLNAAAGAGYGAASALEERPGLGLAAGEDGPAANPLFRTRRIPQAVRDAVWRRDGGQCVYVPPDGSRCPERGGLEFDHVVPYALGGASNNPANIRLLCKAHNLMLARGSLGGIALRWLERKGRV